MRSGLLAAAALVVASPAVAGTPEEIVAHGMIVTRDGFDIEVTFTPDGKLTALGDQITGVWRIGGDKLCTTNNIEKVERCEPYPHDKKSGERFEVPSPEGPTIITIK
jgi:hypothetical protein